MPPGKSIVNMHSYPDKPDKGRENLLFKAAKENNIDVLKRLIGENVDPTSKGSLGENVLHIAALYNNQEILVSLLDEFPFLINKPIECDAYKGETVLHIAIVNQNSEMVRELIARKADMKNARATGNFFAPRRQGQHYYGEYVTSFAAYIGNREILQTLVENGAPLEAQDSQGNTVFHILVLHQNKSMACKLYDFLATMIPKKQLSDLESLTNNDGMTPLKLAAQQGNIQMFEYFIKKRRHTILSFGPVGSTLYDLTGIDSWDDRISVIDIICASNNSARNLLEITPLKELIHYKWTAYGYKYFLLCTILYIMYTIILTLCCLYRPIMEELPYQEGKAIIRKPLHEAYKTRKDYWRLCGEIIVVIGGILSLVSEILQFVRKGSKHFFGSTVTGGPFHFVMLLYACFIIAVVILRFVSSDGETVMLSLALISAWCNVIYFGRGFRLLGPLCIMIQKMVLGDLIKFCILLIAVLIGFAAAFDVHFQEINTTTLPNFDGFPATTFTLFQLMMGLDDLPLPENIAMPKMILFLYIVYMFFGFVLLMNLLIALMTHTHFRVTNDRTSLWKAQVAATTIMLERSIPCRLWPRTGIPGELLGLERGRWYLRVEERNNTSFCPLTKTQASSEPSITRPRITR
ncbi:transient receptor potential cation channel subfamily V member 5 [Xenopus laevis]|uniref:Transient receptor potential cation channel subfamily V member 5 n=2 Tax=Xenopus laevis TaxID=8355 RepID=A0A1L8GA58_XENLA|nr:transient receptor potential cation channel subfamily V member 5 [Xenopus laevis]OCT80807.1 hypothetical protein XELAEV_18027618mg [Xenopus laevis]